MAVTLVTMVLAAVANSTAYSPCSAGPIMADTSHVRPGSVAMNTLPLGTRIWARGPGGRMRWTVRDRYGHGTQLDFWVASCSMAEAWGRRDVRYRIGWKVRRGHAKPLDEGIPAYGRVFASPEV